MGDSPRKASSNPPNRFVSTNIRNAFLTVTSSATASLNHHPTQIQDRSRNVRNPVLTCALSLISLGRRKSWAMFQAYRSSSSLVPVHLFPQDTSAVPLNEVVGSWNKTYVTPSLDPSPPLPIQQLIQRIVELGLCLKLNPRCGHSVGGCIYVSACLLPLAPDIAVRMLRAIKGWGTVERRKHRGVSLVLENVVKSLQSSWLSWSSSQCNQVKKYSEAETEDVEAELPTTGNNRGGRGSKPLGHSVASATRAASWCLFDFQGFPHCFPESNPEQSSHNLPWGCSWDFTLRVLVNNDSWISSTTSNVRVS